MTNVRVITATNRNLRDLITQGQFREDLFYRINVIHLVVPPLRERREDVPLLVEHFLRRFTSQVGSGLGLPAGYANGNGHGNGAGDYGVVNGSGVASGLADSNGHGRTAVADGPLVRAISPEAWAAP